MESLLTALLRQRRWLLVLALAWMALIFALSAQTGLHVPALFPHLDKLLHSLLFGIFGVICGLLVMSDGARPTPWHVLLVGLMAMGYGGLDEFHQSLVPGRSPDILDLAADTGGGLSGALLVLMLLRRYLRY